MKKEDWEKTNVISMARENYNSINVLKDDLKELKDEVKNIRENHLTHMEKAIYELKTDMKWLKRFFFITATAAIGGLITSLLTLIFK